MFGRVLIIQWYLLLLAIVTECLLRSGFHKGVDLAAATGAPILATKAGTVLTAGWSNSFGNWVHLDHGDGVTSRYGHASSLLVSAWVKLLVQVRK